MLAACFDPPPAGGGGPNVTSRIESYDIPIHVNADIDILFVVDNTTAMAPHAENVSALAAALEAAVTDESGDLPNVRVGVTTTELASAGALRYPDGVAEPYLVTGFTPRFERETNFSGSLGAALSALLAVGTSSNAAVAPLDAMKLAFDNQPDFVRPDAYLMVVTIAASDDASAGAIADYAAVLKGRKTDPLEVIVSGIYPTSAPRIDAFHDAFPNRGYATDIDSADWSDSLVAFSQIVRTVLGVGCYIEPADLVEDVPGPQYDCAMSAIYSDGFSEPLPQCIDGVLARCFEFIPEPLCMESGYARLGVRGYPGRKSPSIRGQCVVN